MDKKEIESMNKYMLQYTGTKTVKAIPMTRGEYNELRGWELPSDEDPSDKGYLVEYEPDGNPNVDGFSGYVSWSPKSTFDTYYQKSEKLIDRLRIEESETRNKIDELSKEISNAYEEDFQCKMKRIQLDAIKAYHKVLVIRINDLFLSSCSCN